MEAVKVKTPKNEFKHIRSDFAEEFKFTSKLKKKTKVAWVLLDIYVYQNILKLVLVIRLQPSALRGKQQTSWWKTLFELRGRNISISFFF